eukprot:GHVT01023815.1.p2 GENE.GHVT01023815.1~~GHVT01023815.1.p2  ORF type:complete len:101 (+),score=19.82 GHVT01023815.1:965-1267(+)
MRVGRCGVDGVLFCVFFLFFEGLNPVCVLQAAVVQAVDAMTPARRRANGISCSVGTPGSASYRRPSGNLSLGAEPGGAFLYKLLLEPEVEETLPTDTGRQ